MKKLLSSLTLIIIMTIIVPPTFAEGTMHLFIPLTLECSHIDIRKDHPRSPVQTPRIEQDRHTLYFFDETDLSVSLYSEEECGELILDYSTTVSSTTSSILLPSNLAGTYIIEVVRGEQHFWGEIELD